MFIYLDDSLLVSQTNPIYDNVIRAMRNLAIAAFESKHILYGDYEIIKAMREHFRYDHDVWEIFNRIFQMYSVLSCPNEISYYLRVAKNSGAMGVDEEGKQYGQVSYSAFEDTQSTQVCNLIGEDFNDCEFYQHVLWNYKKRKRINIPCRFKYVSGAGGRTIDNVLNCVCDNKQISICIVDTDLKYKGQRPASGSTYSKCRRFGKKIPIYKFVALEVQEVENLIPFNVIDFIPWYDDNRENKRSFDCLRNNAKSELVLPFFDIKKGIVNDALLRNDVEYRNLAIMCYYLNPTLSSNGDFNAYIGGLEENAVVYPHLILNLLKKYLDYVKDNPGFHDELLEFQRDEWDKIGCAMLNMGCARNKEAIV